MNMKLVLFALVATCVCICAARPQGKGVEILPRDQPWSSCGNGKDHFHISEIQISPDPPVIGKNVTATLIGNLDETVTGGTVHITLQYHYIWWHTVLDQTVQICSADPAVRCPIVADNYNLNLNILVPKQVNGQTVPTGDYKGTVQMMDQNNQEITCVNFAVSLVN